MNLKSETEKLNGLIKISKNAGWFLPHENICWVSERHCILNLDERGRIHSLSEPAIAYPDGWAIYAVHGVRVPEYIILRPQEITVQKIEDEENTEIKRVMIEQYDREFKGRYLKDSGAKLIHSEKVGLDVVELYRKEMKNDEPIHMIKVINSTAEPDGTFKEYFLRVPPHINNAREAVAWTFGLEAKDYNISVET